MGVGVAKVFTGVVFLQKTISAAFFKRSTHVSRRRPRTARVQQLRLRAASRNVRVPWPGRPG